MATKKPKKVVRKKRTPARMIRNSEFSLHNTCAWAWNRSYNIRRRPIRENPALRFGSLIHAALELRYPPGIKRGPKPAISFEKLYDKELASLEKEWGPEMIRDAEDEWVEMRQLGVEMLENYLDVYGKDEDWKVIASEMTFKVPVYSPEHPEGGYVNLIGERIPKRVILFYFVGTMDGVWQNRMDGGIRINDYKTTKNDPTKEAQGKYILDPQATAYWTWGADFLIEKGILKPREVDALDGMLYTFLRKASKDMRPKNAEGYYLNKPKKADVQAAYDLDPKMTLDDMIEAVGDEALQLGEVSANQPAPLFHREVVYRSETARDRARERAVEMAIDMEQKRRGIRPIYKSPDTGQTGHCSWCGYRDICELHEEGADWEELERASMTPWDPYDAHEVADEGKR